MFIIRANFADSFEINSTLNETSSFFSNFNNYIDLMPNLENIHTDGKGITRWIIEAKIPFVGKMKQSFAVDFLTTSDMIEWHPSPTETQNYLRSMAAMVETSANKVQVKYSQFVEIRRQQARELHPLAAMAGERNISQGMQAEIDLMLKTFISKAKERLEKV